MSVFLAVSVSQKNPAPRLSLHCHSVHKTLHEMLACAGHKPYLHSMQEVQRSGQAGNTLQKWIDVSQQLHFADSQDAAHSS